MHENRRRVVIVTGASKGIGKAIAKTFGANGDAVVVNYLENPENAERVVEEIRESGGEGLAIQADVSDFEATEALVKQTLETFGRVDVLINNSGINRDNLMLRMKEADFDSVLDVNLKGAWNMIKHVTRPMFKQNYGRIINISSVVGLIGNPGQANYVASKAGLIGLTKSLAKEYGKKQVTINAIAPGFIETQMTKELSEEIRKTYLEQIPLGHFGSPDDVARAALFLASEDAGYISGQTLGVNGGMFG